MDYGQFSLETSEAFIVSMEGKILGTWATGKARKWVRGVGGGLILVRVGGGAGLIPTRVGRRTAPLAHLSSPRQLTWPAVFGFWRPGGVDAPPTK
jgi:hypothetical protein